MSFRTISALELRDLLVQQPGLPLIDVRMPCEFREVHVAGADADLADVQNKRQGKRLNNTHAHTVPDA